MRLPRFRIVALILGGGVLLIVAAGLALLKYMGDGIHGLTSCSEEFVSQVVSTEKKHVATVFIGNCGATTGYTTHVNVRRVSNPYRAEESGAISQGVIWATEGKQPVFLEWKEPLILEIVFRNENPSDRHSPSLSWQRIRVPVNE